MLVITVYIWLCVVTSKSMTKPHKKLMLVIEITINKISLWANDVQYLIIGRFSKYHWLWTMMTKVITTWSMLGFILLLFSWKMWLGNVTLFVPLSSSNFVLSISWVCSFSLDKLYWLPRNVGYIWCNGIIHDRCIERVKKQCAKVISKVSKLSIIII